jgi:phosphoenolpyruvate carboxykinase (GTP)
MAMKPFCGYNYGDYWAHWLSFAKRADNLPPVFHVNWFRKDADGSFMWPGFGDNMRVLEWIVRRYKGEVSATNTAIGEMPVSSDLNLAGLDISSANVSALLEVDEAAWREEIEQIRSDLEAYGDHLPAQMLEELDKTRNALQ